MFDGLYDLRSRAFEKLQELLFEEQKRQFRLKHIRVSHPRRGRVKLKVPATLEDVKGLSLKTVAWTQYLKWYKEDWSERRKAIAVVLNQHPKLCNIAERIDHMASPKKSWWRKKAEDALSFVPGLACSYAREELSVESGAACGLALLSKSTFQFVSRMKILAKKVREM